MNTIATPIGVLALSFAACGGTNVPKDMGPPGNCRLGSPMGTCLTFTPSTTLGHIDWNEGDAPCGIQPGASQASATQHDVSATCPNNPTTDPNYSLGINLTGGWTLCNMISTQVPIKAGDSIPVPMNAQDSVKALLAYATVELSTPSGTYIGEGGNISVTAISETSISISYNVTVNVPTFSGSWSISGNMSSDTNCP